MSTNRWASPGRLAGCALAWASVVVAGCSANVGQSEPTGETTQSQVSGAVVHGGVTLAHESGNQGGDQGGDREGDRACSPRTCCFPTAGGGWQDDPLENQLRALGCTTPAPYSQTGARFFAWSRCAFTLDLLELVLQYRGTPWEARLTENRCAGFEPGKVDVVFDPTCGTCGPAPQ